jgi:RNA-binding protein YhbY
MVDKRDLARIWAEEKPHVRIGKDGIDSGTIEEVKRQLKKYKVIKVRFLRSAADLKVSASELANRTSSEVWGQRGAVIVLARKKTGTSE